MQDPATVEGHWFDCRWEGAAVLRCHGELDTLSQTALRDALDGVPQSIPVVVDLGCVRFLDCGAIGELVRARNARRAEGADLHVGEPSALALRMLSIVELDDMVLGVDVNVADDVHRPATVGATDVVDGLLELADDRMLRHRVDARDDRFDGADSPSTLDLSDDLRRTSRDSIVIEQAGGFIAERLGVDVDVSLDILWSKARQRGEPVASTAAGLVDGSIELTTSPPSPAPVGEHSPAVVDRVSGSTLKGG